MGSGADKKPEEDDLKTILLKAETRIKILQVALKLEKKQYGRLFDYWNDKYPDEMSKYVDSL